MTNEKEWWDEYIDYQTHIPTEFFVPISRIKDLVEEAERRGQVKALEEMKKKIYSFQGWGDLGDTEEEAAIRLEVKMRFKEFFDAALADKLNELNNL